MSWTGTETLAGRMTTWTFELSGDYGSVPGIYRESAEGADRLVLLGHGGGGQEAVLADWRMTLDVIAAECGARPTGWWGLSMGTMMSLPVSATRLNRT